MACRYIQNPEDAIFYSHPQIIGRKEIIWCRISEVLNKNSPFNELSLWNSWMYQRNAGRIEFLGNDENQA